MALYKDAGDRPGEGRFLGEKKGHKAGKKPEKMGDLWILWEKNLKKFVIYGILWEKNLKKWVIYGILWVFKHEQ